MIKNLNLRLADTTDLESLATILNRANSKRDKLIVPSSHDNKTLKEVQDRMVRNSAWTLLAEIEDRIVGFILTHPLINKDGTVQDSQTEHLSLIMVDPDYWGLGIAGALLKESFNHAKSNGKTKISLWTRKQDNDRARNLYERYDFLLSGVERKSEYGEQVQYIKKIR